MTSFWSWYIILLVLINIIGCSVLLHFTRRNPIDDKSDTDTTGHSFDGIEELNSPLPRWWMWVFWLSIIFSVIYLALFPGLGSYPGKLGWTSAGQLQEEQKVANAQYGPMFEHYGSIPLVELAKNRDAMVMAERLFANNCAQCHGSDARGGKGFPDLTDANWLYGGSPEAIERSISQGRNGAMPALGRSLGAQKVSELTAYILTLNNRNADKDLAAKGKRTFETVCMACHGMDAKGNQALGAPDLTNNIWLYGGDEQSIAETINSGRNGHMPAHKNLLGADKVHILAAYVYGLSKDD